MTNNPSIPIKGTSYYYSEQQTGIDRRTKKLVIDRCLPFLRGMSVLDLGFVDGSWTDRILERGWNVDIVEGAELHVAAARTRYNHNKCVRIFQAMFSDFVADRSYDTIIAGDVLRYVNEPVRFLAVLGSWLAADGVLVVTVPNSLSFHRRIGTLMDLERHPMDENSRDAEVGNLRSYDRYRLRSEIIDAGLSIIELRGCFLKPLSSEQMAGWDDRLLKAFLEIGNELEDYAWFLYAICRR
jgi:trans-aconitate methyltransferase